MAYTKYSLTPADNNAAPPNGAPEGMLPSAVNDTMRDMMSQIRDVGDGIRTGVYTLTAPVITGGSITGVALSGNTLTNPVITGGSINNTPIGASTANTGAFTTLSASSTATLNTLVSSGATITGGSVNNVPIGATTASTGRFTSVTATGLTSGRVAYVGTAGLLQDDADFTFNGTTVTMANDASISGLTVGKGGGALSVNTAVGFNVGNGNTTGTFTAVGNRVLQLNTTGLSNVGIGGNDGVNEAALQYNTTGNNNTAVGVSALTRQTTGSNNTAVGNNALLNNTTASNNTAVGYQAGFSNTTGIGTYLGYQAGYNQTSGAFNAYVGLQAGFSMTTGTRNTLIGGYTGNNDGLDIRTLSSFAVISDGDGNRQITMREGQTLALDSAVPNAGTGITFPATQSASSDANTLDDYEEGSWTPALGASITNPTGMTYSILAGRYIKIGKLVQIEFIMVLSSKGTGGSGIIQINGLPFTHATDGVFATAVGTICNPQVLLTSPFLQINDGGAVLICISGNGATANGVDYVTQTANNTDVRGTLCYKTAN